jgi:GT2 family glycosyltransferase
MDREPGYGIFIITRNHAETLGACLEAVARLAPPPREVVVVDNASSDGSAELAGSFAEKLPLRTRKSPSNTGFAAAANAAISESRAPWLLSLNPDAAPRPDFVARLLAAVARHPDGASIGSATGRLLRSEDAHLSAGDVLDAAGMVVTPAGRHLDRGAGEPDDGRYRRAAWVFGGTGAATLYRRRALEDVAYPDGEVFASTFFAYREDAELAWRLQWRGWRCLYVPGSVAAHGRRFRPEGGRRGHDEINRHSVRNRFLLRWHCADLGWHLACLPWWLLRDLAVVGACLTVERSSLPALGELWRLRADAAGRRRWVLGRRTVPSRRLRRFFRKQGWTEEITEP